MVRKTILVGALLIVLGACGSSARTGQGTEIERQPCTLSDGIEAQCGSLTVPENRQKLDGHTIDLNLAIIPARSSVPQPDPLFMLAGGPGQSAVESFPDVISLLEDINEDRDIVLVDQRGTGKSNSLDCPNLETDGDDPDLTDEEVVEMIKVCAAELAESADVTQYTTDIAMTDLDAVRQALGYDQINIYGGSYGTRAAQAYARLFPERVRTLILDAVTAPELILFQQMPRDGQRALEILFERCREDEDCHSTFPDLETEYETISSRLEAEPVLLELTHPLSGESIELVLTYERLSNLVYRMLYSSELVSLFPLLVHDAFEEADYDSLVLQGLLVGEDTGMSIGLLYVVACAEDAGIIDVEQARQLQEETLFPLRAENFLEICTAFPPAEIAADFRQPLQDDIPTLLLSGGADPVTPPHYAEQVAAHLSKSRHLVVPGYGHGLLVVGCVPKIMTAFLEEGSADNLDTNCLDAVQPPPFFIEYTGPGP